MLLLLLLPRGERGRLRLSVPLALFGLWCLASYIWSADPQTSVRRLVDLVALLLVGWATSQVLGAAGARRVLARAVKYVLVVSVVTLVALPGWATEPGGDGAPGWHGPFPHKNGLGFFCALAAITLWSELPRGWPRRLWLGLVAVLLIGSQSASALAAGATAAVVMAWFTLRDANGSLRVRIAADTAAVSALGVLAAVAVLWPEVFFAALGRDTSLTGRRAIWTAVDTAIDERPLLGYGFGGVWGETSPVTLALWRESRFDAFYAHSGYLDIWLQVGGVGLALLVVLLIVTLRGALQARAHQAGAWPLGVMVLLLLTAITESEPFTGNGLLLIALLAGGTSTLRRQSAGPLGESVPGSSRRTEVRRVAGAPPSWGA
ncbi:MULTISPECIES: O-antigen ligase family protein [unclassified Modestobacter]